MAQRRNGGGDDSPAGPGAAGAEAAPESGRRARLGLAIGDQHWLVDLSQAGEIVPVPETIVPVPLTRDWLLGLVNLRGALHTVVDLQRFAGLGRTQAGKEARLLALGARLNFNAAILVTRMLGLRDLGAMPVVPDAPEPGAQHAGRGDAAPPAAPGRPAWIGPTRVDADGRRWRELDLARLASSRDFLLVGR